MNMTEYYRLQLNARTGRNYEIATENNRFLKCDGRIIAEAVDSADITILLKHIYDLVNEVINTLVVTPTYHP